MFDARSFMRKRAVTISQPVIAHGYKFKLTGDFADTPAEIAALAGKQLEPVKCTEAVKPTDFPEDGIVRKAAQAVLTPVALSEFVGTKPDGTKPEKTTPTDVKARGGVDKALTNGK